MRHSPFHTLTLFALAVFSASSRAPANSPHPRSQSYYSFTMEDSAPLMLNPVAAFTDDSASGASGILKARLEAPSNELIEKCGFSFDMLRNETMPGMYGPTSMLMNVIGQNTEVWKTELLTLTTESSPLIEGSFLHSESPAPSQEGVNFMPGMPPRFARSESVTTPSEADPHSFTPDLHLNDIHGLGFETKSSLAPLMMVAVMIVLARVRRTRLMAH